MADKDRRFITEGKGIFYLTIIWAIFIRLYALYQKESLTFEITEASESYVWTLWGGYLTNNYINISLSFLMLALVAIFINMSNVCTNFLKIRTYMPPLFVFLFLSSLQSYIYLGPIIIGAAIWGYIIYLLFINYATVRKAEFGAHIGFYLALSSLFDPIYILYLPIIWLGMHQMHEINFRGWLSTFFGMMLWYVPLLTYVFFSNDIDSFAGYLQKYFVSDNTDLPILSFDSFQFIFFVVVAIIQIILSLENTMSRFGSKIQVCRSINLLIIIELASFVFMVVVPNAFYPTITVLLICYTLHISQIFSAMPNKNLMTRLFAVLSLIFLAFSIYSLNL